MTTERFIRRTMEDRGYEPDEIEDAVDAWAEERLNDRADRDQEARQASAFRPGKESAKPVRASLGATDQSAAVAQEHQPCELFPIARA